MSLLSRAASAAAAFSLSLSLSLFAVACAVRDPNTQPRPPVTGPRAPAVCAGVPCPEGQICCFTTGACFDPVASRDACTVGDMDAGPPESNTSRDGPAPVCASDADCLITEYCDSGGGFCTGAGHCVPRNNCATCTSRPGDRGDPPPGTSCQLCGCDGVTYASPQAACAAGVRVSGFATTGTCGAPQPPAQNDAGGILSTPRIACGTDAECFTGMRCCALYGFCVDPACTTCCEPPPPGTRFPCTSNLDCADFGGFCAGTGCGTPGGCTGAPGSSDCGGELSAVCGCDGRDYQNECWALHALTRVAHTGSCADAG